MREELDDILSYIGAPFLTTAEWGQAAAVLNGRADERGIYQALYAVLSGRGDGTSEVMTALHTYFAGRGLTQQDLKPQAFSNIFIGAPLE